VSTLQQPHLRHSPASGSAKTFTTATAILKWPAADIHHDQLPPLDSVAEEIDVDAPNPRFQMNRAVGDPVIDSLGCGERIHRIETAKQQVSSSVADITE